MSDARNNAKTRKKVAVIGLGNTGSPLVALLARLELVGEIVCVDPDTYSRENLPAQAITTGDIGVPKATAVAKRLHAIRPDLQVTAIVNRVENVPWGTLRADVVCGCVDSKAARAAINLIARRLGIPYVDSGVRADGLLARVDTYAPDPDAACMECGWGTTDYESLGRIYSCTGEVREAPGTGATASLGALAAAIQALECQRVLSGDFVGGRQIVLEAAAYHLYANTLRRNHACRFDHSIRAITASAATTPGGLLEANGTPEATLAVEGKSWVTHLVCPECGHQSHALHLRGRGCPRQCPACLSVLQPTGFGMLPRLELSSASAGLLTRQLTSLGLRRGDVVTLAHGDSEGQCYELTHLTGGTHHG